MIFPEFSINTNCQMYADNCVIYASASTPSTVLKMLTNKMI